MKSKIVLKDSRKKVSYMGYHISYFYLGNSRIMSLSSSCNKSENNLKLMLYLPKTLTQLNIK